MTPPVLDALLRANLFTPTEILPLPGGASTRKYFRALVTGAPHKIIAMFVPDGDRPEEAETKRATRTQWPFLEVRELLASKGIRVPKLYLDASKEGWLLLEDLGDETLAEVIARDPNTKGALYTQAVTDLAKAQAALEDLPADSIVRTRSFDEALLLWEIDHFREWGLDAQGLSLSASARSEFDAIANSLAARIAKMPYGFVHRDYQSRNLMVEKIGEPLVWIDFQDALMGPRIYDLVALLGDSYQTFDRPFIAKRLSVYSYERGIPDEIEALTREFHLVTVQRKLKDAGRFVFIDRVKGNPAFLPYIAPTLQKVSTAFRALTSDPEMVALHQLLRHVLPD